MLRPALIITIIFSAALTSRAEIPVDFLLQNEYKNDTIDYSDKEKLYLRERLTLLFSRESAFNLSYIYLTKEQENKFTWYLNLNDISPNASFLLGNYFTHFGTGLLVGRKRIYDPDIFSISTNPEENAGAFSPCGTGNPAYAFNGIAGSFNADLSGIKLFLNAFYSIRERFIDEDSYDKGQVSSTMETLDAGIDYSYNHNESIEIYTGGAMLSCSIMENIMLQAYSLKADIRSRYKEEIAWEHEDAYDVSTGISGLTGFGFFSLYRDDYFGIFIDGVLTQKEIISGEGRMGKEYGRGILYGLRFTPPFLSMNITGKETESGFYSPYSSPPGDALPESAWFFDTAIKPYSNLKISAQASSQQRKKPSSADNGLPATNKESAGITWNYGFLDELSLSARRREKTDEEKEEKDQYLGVLNFRLLKSLKLKLRAIFQYKNNSDPSGIFDTGLDFIPSERINIQVHFLSGYISEDNPVYVIVSPIKDSSTRGLFIREKSDIFVLKSDLKINAIFISFRHLCQFHHSNTISKTFEIYAGGYF